jgi:transcriptional regulator with XRE-family HTH domain
MSKLLEYRVKLNLTQEELAEKSGISVRTIQRIEAGNTPKGYTLKTLAEVLNISEAQLFDDSTEQQHFNYQLIKLINLSSLFFFIPLGNILIPLFFMHLKKEVNNLTKQIISVQILWTIMSFVIFFLFVFIKNWLSLNNQLTLVVLILSALVNLYIIIRNTVEIDKQNKLYIKLNFSFI